MENAQTAPATKTPATIIDMGEIKLAPAKFEVKPAAGERVSTKHHVYFIRSIGVKLGGDANQFTHENAREDGTPEHMKCFAQGLVNVILYDQLDVNLVLSGEARVDVEICAIIVRDKDGRIADRHVYLVVRPAAGTETGEPDRVLTVHHADSIPRYDATVYRGRKSAVAIRTVTPEERAIEAEERATDALPATNLRDPNVLKAALGDLGRAERRSGRRSC